MTLKLLLTAAIIVCCGPAFALGEDQLYTGDARTVEPGRVRLQTLYRTSFGELGRLGAASLSTGITDSIDIRGSYGYLWTFSGPNFRLGPSVGAKWRFVGDGRTNTSIALSGLCASGQRSGVPPSKPDYGALLILQHPTPYAIVLVNAGRVFIGDDLADLHYFAAALARPVSPQVLVAAQYINVGQIGEGIPGRDFHTWVGALVYHPNRTTGYSLQIGYVPDSAALWNAALSFAVNF